MIDPTAPSSCPHAPSAAAGPERDELTARLARLEESAASAERRSRRWRRAGLAAFGLLAATWLTGAASEPQFDVLEVRRLQLVNADGALVASLTADDRGGRLDLWTATGRNVARLAANEHGGDFNLWTNQGTSAAGVWAGPSGGRLSVWDTHGTDRVALEAAADGPIVALQRGSFEFLRLDGHDDVGGRLRIRTADDGPELLASAESERSLLRLRGADRTVVTLDASPIETALDLTGRRGRARMAAGPAGAESILDTITGGRLHLAADAPADFGSTGPRIDLVGQRSLLGRFGIDDGAGGAIRLYNEDGRRSAAIAARNDGGLLNLFNGREVAVVKAGVTPTGHGGAVAVLNARGLPVVAAESTDRDEGRIAVANADANAERVVTPDR